MSQSEFNRLGLAQSARAIAAGEITSEALVRACLDRVAQRESVVKAWVDIDFDRAIAGARQRDRTPSCGPLHGVPIGV